MPSPSAPQSVLRSDISHSLPSAVFFSAAAFSSAMRCFSARRWALASSRAARAASIVAWDFSTAASSAPSVRSEAQAVMRASSATRLRKPIVKKTEKSARQSMSTPEPNGERRRARPRVITRYPTAPPALGAMLSAWRRLDTVAVWPVSCSRHVTERMKSRMPSVRRPSWSGRPMTSRTPANTHRSGTNQIARPMNW